SSATTPSVTSPLSLHDALPIFSLGGWSRQFHTGFLVPRTTQDTAMVYVLYLYRAITVSGHSFQSVLIHRTTNGAVLQPHQCRNRSEEHTSELQSRENLVCRLLL